MKLQKLLTPIFIVGLLALLQVSASAQTPSAQPSPNANSENLTQESNAAAGPTITATPESGAKPTAAQRNAQTYYYYAYPQERRDFPAYVEAFSTVGLLIFAAIQMWLANRSTKATEAAAKAALDTALASTKAAEASKQGAEASEKALRADRPYLLIKSATLENFQNELDAFQKGDPAWGAPVCSNFGFENFGKSPAVIEKILARLVVTKHRGLLNADDVLTEEPYPQFGEYGACKWVDRLRNVIAVGDMPSAYKRELETRDLQVAPSHLNTETFDRINNHQLVIVLHGVIRYTDVLQRKHETEFIGAFDPAAHRQPTGSFIFEFDDHPQRENEVG